MTALSPTPWSVRVLDTPHGRHVAVVDRNGGVVCTLKRACGNKVENASAIVAAVNGLRAGQQDAERAA